MPADGGPPGVSGGRGVRDDFDEDARRGSVIGSAGTDGWPRLGVDVEGVLSIDHGAVRLAPLRETGWGRVALTHGPVEVEPGWGSSVLVLAAHNAADTRPIGPFGLRVARWVLGNEVDPLPTRLLRWPAAPRREPALRRLRRWRHRRHMVGATPDESLATGLFAAADVGPVRGDQAFVVRTAGPDNGELTVRVLGHDLPVISSLQNIPVLYVALVTDTGTLYGVSSLEGARDLAAYPLMRPLAIDPSPPPRPAYPGLHQRVISQEGFSNDTRIFAMRTAPVDAARAWCSTALVADRLAGAGALDGRLAARGGSWVADGDIYLDAEGAGGDGTATLAVGDQVGLAKVQLHTGPLGAAGFLGRSSDGDVATTVVADGHEAALRVTVEGTEPLLVPLDRPHGPMTLQVRDDRDGIAVALDGDHRLQVPDVRLPGPGGRIGITASRGGRASGFEAHPAAVPVPEVLRATPPCPRRGDRVVVDEPFASRARDLDGHVGADGHRWERTIGTGRFELDAAVGARAVASVGSPMVGRTAYTVPWEEAGGADVVVTICPPGAERGEGHTCRAGVVFVEDDRNHLIVNTWLADDYGGASISVFPRLGGFEDVYDAVWSNVGDRIAWGRPFELRVTFDEARFLASVDGEPVIYRAMSDLYPTVDELRVTRVGIVTNWEWGLDTGSCFRRFTASALPAVDPVG